MHELSGLSVACFDNKKARLELTTSNILILICDPTQPSSHSQTSLQGSGNETSSVMTLTDTTVFVLILQWPPILNWPTGWQNNTKQYCR